MFAIVLFITVAIIGDSLQSDDDRKQPLYKYRYETEDTMKTAAASVPIRGYHVVEGGYYPEESNLDHRYTSGDHFSHDPSFRSSRYFTPSSHYHHGSSFGSSGYSNYPSDSSYGLGLDSLDYGSGGRYGGRPEHYYRGGRGYHGGLGGHGGGEYVDKTYYEGGKKNLNGGSYEKAGGERGEQGNHGEEGYNQDKVVLKDSKGDKGYYNDEQGGKKIVEDGKNYNGVEHVSEEGKSGEEKKKNVSHKKGHSIKGFKTSHHKDESGKTEEFFDEANDEGDHSDYDANSGKFSEQKQKSYKGGHSNDKFNADQRKKEGHYDNEHSKISGNSDHGEYGQKKYYDSGKVYGVNNGADEHSLLGHQEQSRFYKDHPYNVPFYSH